MTHPNYNGFTLIELSIVLVVIGLIVGGVLVGRDLISASEARAQITQIDKFQAAVNTFRGKYGYLPGDIPDPDATKFGFQPRGTNPGEGDGDGVLMGVFYNSTVQGHLSSSGELGMFWGDLSQAKLIPGSFTVASVTDAPTIDVTPTSTPSLSAYFPVAAIDATNYVYAYSGGTYPGIWQTTGINYFGLSAVSKIAGSVFPPGRIYSTPNFSVAKAYAIDMKMDDGKPISGKVMATYLNNDIMYTDGTNALYSTPNTTAIPPAATTCTDNGNVAYGPQVYTMSVNSGQGRNCALSFQFR